MDFPVTNRWLFFGFKMLISQGAQKTSMSGNGQTAGVAKLISSLETISKGDFHGNFHPRSKNWYQKNHQHIILEHHVISISRQYQVTTNSPPKPSHPLSSHFHIFTTLFSHNTHTHSIGWTPWAPNPLPPKKDPKTTAACLGVVAHLT